MKKIIYFVASVLAHKTVDEDVPDDVLLRGTDDFGDMDLSFIKNANYEKEIVKYNLKHGLSSNSEKFLRGELVITKNKNTNEIMKIDIEEQDSARSGMEDSLSKACASGDFYQLEI
jgi:hypothetical protein